MTRERRAACILELREALTLMDPSTLAVAKVQQALHWLLMEHGVEAARAVSLQIGLYLRVVGAARSQVERALPDQHRPGARVQRLDVCDSPRIG